MPGDFAIHQGNIQHYPVPVTYSLCASWALGLLYYFMKAIRAASASQPRSPHP